MRGRLASAALGAALLGAASGAPAHHAFTAQYDSERPKTLHGVVVKIDWLNPHAYFFVDVTDENSGEVSTWAVEMSSPVALMRRGWTRNSLKIGDVVDVEGLLARDGSPAVNARSVVLTASGRRLFTRSEEEERAAARPEEP